MLLRPQCVRQENHATIAAQGGRGPRQAGHVIDYGAVPSQTAVFDPTLAARKEELKCQDADGR